MMRQMSKEMVLLSMWMNC